MSTDNPTTTTSLQGQRDARAQAIEDFVSRFAPGENQGLTGEMMVTLCRLARDECGRGEMKILNSVLKELRYAFKVFAPYSEIPKVSMFGSARTAPDHPQYLQAIKFAELIRQAGWMVITGAGDGIMRAGHHGATRAASFGVAIRLPFEQSTNVIIADDEKLMNFKYFFTRKLILVKEARAIALFPGGMGTQDEGFEALTLVQTGKAPPMPVVMIDEPDGTYWQHWRTYLQSELLRTGMIGPEDMHLMYLTDRAEKAVEHITHFYRRYHSSRFVKDVFVIRLRSAIADDLVRRLNDEFADLIEDGRMRQTGGALPDEHGEYAELPRLVFAYNNCSAGRLRLLVNALNDAD